MEQSKTCDSNAAQPLFRPWERSPVKSSFSTVSKRLIFEGFPNYTFQLPYESTPRINDAQSTTGTPDSGYDSDRSNSPTNTNRQRPYLNPTAVSLMERWYQDNMHHPYPTGEVVQHMADLGGISTTQVRKWMANKRSRSFNTLSYNRTIHPKRLQRLQKEYRASIATSIARHHPYILTSTPRIPDITRIGAGIIRK